jgi:hypothetical protein
MYTTVQVPSEFGKFAYTAICMRNVYTDLIIHAFLLVFIAQIRSLSGALPRTIPAKFGLNWFSGFREGESAYIRVVPNACLSKHRCQKRSDWMFTINHPIVVNITNKCMFINKM